MDSQATKPLRVLVTGGAGFIGSHVVEALEREHHKILVIDNLSSGKRQRLSKKVTLVATDIASPRAAKAIAKFRPQRLIHLAAQPIIPISIKDPAADAQTNVVGSLAVLMAAHQSGCRHITFMSSAAVYSGNKIYPARETHPPHPTSAYGAAKLSFEHYLKVFASSFGWTTTILRCANVYGPRQTPRSEAAVVATFCDRLRAGEPVIIHGDGSRTRDFIFVADVVEAILKTISQTPTGIFNVSTGRETTVAELYKHLAEIAGSQAKPRFKKKAQGGDARSQLSPALIKKELSWQAMTPLKAGLQKTYADRSR